MFVFSLLVLSLAGHNATGNLPFLRLSLDSPAYPFNEKVKYNLSIQYA